MYLVEQASEWLLLEEEYQRRCLGLALGPEHLYGKTMFALELLAIPLYDRDELAKSLRELIYLDACKTLLRYIHFTRSYVPT